MFELVWTNKARAEYDELKQGATSGNARGLFKQVNKALGYLQSNPRHPSLATHKYQTLEHPYDPQKDVFEAYAQNKTPGAYRIFWCYGPDRQQITIMSVVPHPD